MDTDPRSTPAQAGRGQKPVSGGLASGRHSGPRGGRAEMQPAQFHFPAAQGQAAPSAAARGALSVAQQFERARTGKALAVLHSTDAGGGGLQGPQRRFEPAADFPSVGAADRGAHFRRLPGLLPARQFARLLAAAGPGPDAALGAGKVRRHPNARRAFSRPPTVGNWSSAATPSPRKTTRCCWPNWAGNCRRNRRRASPRKVNCCPNKPWCRPFG